jgi:YfiR/HmsC-like
MAFLRAITALTSALLLVQSPQASEYQVKAVFLFNFAQFVDWQPVVAQDPRAPLLIGILGDDPFGGFLDETVRGERLGTRPFEIRRYRELTDIRACNILFISRSESERVGEILAALGKRPILTVSDGDDFAKRGGMIQFVNDKNRIRLRINLEAAQAANVTISSKLLRVAEIVRTARP